MDFYERLNIPNDADDAAIQKAFRDLSLAMHPDKANISTIPRRGTETSEERRAREQRNHERFVNIIEARDTLLDPTKRRDYDAKLRRAAKYSTDRSGRSGEPSRSSKPSKSGESRKPREPSKPKDPQQNAAPQESEDKTAQSSNTLQWLEYLVYRFGEQLTTFHGLEPRSRSSSAYSEYYKIVGFFEQIIAMTDKLMRRLREMEARFRENGSPARAQYDSLKSQCSTHVANARHLLGEVDLDLAVRDRAVSLGTVYRCLYATFSSFLA